MRWRLGLQNQQWNYQVAYVDEWCAQRAGVISVANLEFTVLALRLTKGECTML